jgi:hypothetical protein
VGESRCLVRNCAHEARVGVPDREHGYARRKIQVPIAVGIEDAPALPSHEDDRCGAIIRELDPPSDLDQCLVCRAHGHPMR